MRRAELIAGDGDKTAAIALAERAVAADDTPRSLLLRYADLAREAEDDAAAERAYRRSEEHTSELQSLMRISYAVFCLTKKNNGEKRKTQQQNIQTGETT